MPEALRRQKMLADYWHVQVLKVNEAIMPGSEEHTKIVDHRFHVPSFIPSIANNMKKNKNLLLRVVQQQMTDYLWQKIRNPLQRLAIEQEGITVIDTENSYMRMDHQEDMASDDSSENSSDSDAPFHPEKEPDQGEASDREADALDAWMERFELEADRNALLGIEVTGDGQPPPSGSGQTTTYYGAQGSGKKSSGNP
ncbi:hypothetical protein BVRB_7g166530 [Beta vulgaris subsp. vulgaris]|nr:hypothetical protein BVRB_7g166530 [Beta vulgaris subsp. vulgaris]